MLKVAIAGATGYTGAELIRLLIRHPKVEIVSVTSEQSAGEPLVSRLPFLKGLCDLTLEKLIPGQLAQKADLIFSALSHTHAIDPARKWIDAGKKVIDLSADYRLQSDGVYEKWYGTTHTEPDLLKKAVYGLPEIYRHKIAAIGTGPCLIANPGCYPTGTLLPLYPFLKSGEIDTQREIIIDAKSGVSGAGRAATDKTHFPEVNEGLVAYNIGIHRHIPEIEQEVTPFGSTIIFTPYLLPINRGILTTIYLPLKRALSQGQLESILEEQYKGEPFIRRVNVPPNLAHIKGSNYCDIAVFATAKGNTAILISAMDNLVKGASGQAIQNMNILMGWDEQEGLRSPGFFP
jgi:N-acetyl-gamma-glutamyl-phosphate reductase